MASSDPRSYLCRGGAAAVATTQSLKIETPIASQPLYVYNLEYLLACSDFHTHNIWGRRLEMFDKSLALSRYLCDPSRAAIPSQIRSTDCDRLGLINVSELRSTDFSGISQARPGRDWKAATSRSVNIGLRIQNHQSTRKRDGAYCPPVEWDRHSIVGESTKEERAPTNFVIFYTNFSSLLGGDIQFFLDKIVFKDQLQITRCKRLLSVRFIVAYEWINFAPCLLSIKSYRRAIWDNKSSRYTYVDYHDNELHREFL